MRLFLAKAMVPEAALREAIAPMSLESWERVGLIGRQNGAAFARLRILPFDNLYVAQEIFTRGLKLAPDFVVGIGAATMTMVNFMIRRPSRLALDMGTGCGLLALLKSAESDRVIAADRNSRAVRMTDFNVRLNGLTNVDCREGDLFEPVNGLKFDLILSNAPFVISPSSGYLYLDGGMQGDQFCQRLVRGAAQHLTEKGYCQFLCNWAHLQGQDWEERLKHWFEGTGCNVWVMRGATEDPTVYAKKWIEHIEADESPDFPRIYEEWMDFYRRERIEAISMGMITMQRSPGAPNWFRIDPQPEVKNRDLGNDIIRIFELKDYLGTVQSDDALLKAALRPNPDLRLDVQYEPAADGWRPLSHVLRIERGLGFIAKTDELAAKFITGCDGTRTVDALLKEIASIARMDYDQMMPGLLHLVRHLIERGFLVPASFA
jgi:hypothetical protein